MRARRQRSLWRCTQPSLQSSRLCSPLTLFSFTISRVLRNLTAPRYEQDPKALQRESQRVVTVPRALNTRLSSDPLPALAALTANGCTTCLLSSAEQCLVQLQKASTLMRRRVLPSLWCPTCTTNSPPKTSQYVCLPSTCPTTPHALLLPAQQIFGQAGTLVREPLIRVRNSQCTAFT